MGGDFCFDDHVNKVTRTAFCHLEKYVSKVRALFSQPGSWSMDCWHI